MKSLFFVMTIVWGLISSAQSSLSPQIRQYIKVFEQHHPRTELFMDVIRLQGQSPEEKSELLAPSTSELGGSESQLQQIYDNHEVQYMAQNIAKKMDPLGPFNNQYAETVQELLQIYLREPQHRRAIQSLFDVITLTYHDNTQKKRHYDRMTSFTQHLLDYAEWTWGAALLWSLRTNPAFMNNQKWYLKPVSSSLKVVPIPKFLSLVYKGKTAKSIHQSPWLLRMGHHIGQKPFFQLAGGLTKNMATMAGVTFGTAALIGTPSYFLYQYNLWPFEHKENPEELLGQNLHQMAILDLGCRTVELAQDIQKLNFDSLDMDGFLETSRLMKVEINNLVDARRYLYEVAYFYNTSQNLSSEIHWNPELAQFKFRGESLSCAPLKGQSVQTIERGLINLNSINRILNTEIKNFSDNYNRYLFKDKENRISEFVTQFQKNQNHNVNLAQRLHSEVPREEIESAIKISFLSLAYIKSQHQTLYQIDHDFISKIPVESDDFILIIKQLREYKQKQTPSQTWEQINPDIRTLSFELAKNIVYEWPSEVFNSYIVHLLESHFINKPQSRLAMTLLFSTISEVIESEVRKGIIPDIDQFIDPSIFNLSLTNMATRNAPTGSNLEGI